MDLCLDRKIALVCGSTGGMGEGVARALADEGAKVMISGRSEEKARAIVESIGSERASHYCIDYSQQSAHIELYRETVERLGPPDILVLNGPGPEPMRAVEIDGQTAREAFNSITAFGIDLVQLALPEMQSTGWGRILSVASSGLVEPIQNIALSNIARLALLGYLKTLSTDLATSGITVNTIVPGRIDTPRVREIDKHNASLNGLTENQAKAMSENEIPMKRYGTPDEVGGLAAFLCSSRADYMTGCMFRCDGGLTRSL